MSRWRSVLFLSLACAAGTACSSKSSDPAASRTTSRPDSGTCTTACCELPQPGTSCAGKDAETCSYAVTCQEGLVLSRTTTCQGGSWQALNDCPVAGGVDARGCPSAQPADKSPCSSAASQSGASCGYSKICDTKLCDASDCVPIHKSATATCSQGLWSTTPLGPC